MPSNPTVARLNRAFTDLDLPFRAQYRSGQRLNDEGNFTLVESITITPVLLDIDAGHRLAVRLEDITEALPEPEPALPGPGQLPLPGV